MAPAESKRSGGGGHLVPDVESMTQHFPRDPLYKYALAILSLQHDVAGQCILVNVVHDAHGSFQALGVGVVHAFVRSGAEPDLEAQDWGKGKMNNVLICMFLILHLGFRVDVF